MEQRTIRLAIGVLAASLFAAAGAPTHAQLRLRDICRVKGQEENTLQGLGLVVGLKGTGDPDVRPTARALAATMKLMGNPIGQSHITEQYLGELSAARNVALVFVTATVPAAGGRQGDLLECRVSAISAKSLAGGYLLATPLLGPRPGSDRVYAFAQGALQIEDAAQPATAKIYNGCRLEEDFYNVFTKDGMVTLVLDRNHAGFQTAQEIADLINTQSYFQSTRETDRFIARALDQVNVQVQIPQHYREDPVLFVSQILNQRILSPQTEARVVVNPKTGSVVIGGDVAIGPVVVTHKNMVIEAGGAAAPSFVAMDTGGQETARLKALVDALNAVKASPEDIIEIIRGVDRNGKLYGKLIVE